jgi:1,4-dihydroxy-2-naphthoate polyprenyltransferase
MQTTKGGTITKIKNCVIATRPWSFPLSLVSVTLGTLVAAAEGPLLWGWYLLVCVGIVCFHATANVYNDYFDTRYGVDQPDSPTARYRPQPILAGLLTPGQLLSEAIILNTVTLIIGLILTFQRSTFIFWIGFIGFLASLFYTAGPLKYKYRALGEFFVFLMWGPLMVEGSYAVQRQILSLKPLYLSIPFGILVALVLLANNIRDIKNDARQGIKTIAIHLGEKSSLRLYVGLIIAAYLLVIVLVAAGPFSPWCLLIVLSFPKAFSLTRTFMKTVPEAADAITAQFATMFGVLLIAGLVLGRVVPL